MSLRLESALGVSGVNRDTELFAEFILRDAPGSFLDVGTGSGYLAIRLALAGAEVAATDLSPQAATLAERNAQRHGVSLAVRVADLLEGETRPWDAIAFNPPFSARPDPRLLIVLKDVIQRIEPLERALMHRMPRSVAAFRCDLVRRFLAGAVPCLRPGGAVYLLLYRNELTSLESMRAGLATCVHSPEELRRRNLAFVKLVRST